MVSSQLGLLYGNKQKINNKEKLNQKADQNTFKHNEFGVHERQSCWYQQPALERTSGNTRT